MGPSLESANRFALEVSNDGSTFTSNGIEIRYFGSPQLSLVDPMPINQEESLEFSVVGVDLPDVNAYVVLFDGVRVASCSFVDDSKIDCKLNGKQDVVGEKTLTLEIEGIHFPESTLTVEIVDIVAEPSSETPESTDSGVLPETNVPGEQQQRGNSPVTSSNEIENNSNEEGGLSTGIIIALALVGVAILLAVIALIWCLTSRGNG